MALLERFYPTHYIASAYDIPYAALHGRGYRGIIFDIDNTLVEHGAPPNDRALALFTELGRIGYQTVIISNNEEERVKSFADAVGSPYIFKAGKPKVGNFIKAMELMATDAGSTFLVGDQLFTDVWGANRAGIMSYRVAIIDKKEDLHIMMKRYLEKVVWRQYLKRDS